MDTIALNNPMIVFTGGGTGGNVHNTKAKDEWVRVIGNEQTQGLMESPQLLWEILLEGRPDLQTAILKRELLECIAAQGIGTIADRYDRSTGSARIFRLLYEKGELPTRWGYFVSSGSNTVGKYLRMESPSYDRATVADFVQRMLTHEIPDLRGIGNDYIWYAGTANESWEGGLSCTKAELPSAKPPQQEVWQPRPDCAKTIDYDSKEGYRIEKEIMARGLRMGFLHGYSDGTFDALFHMLDEAVAKGKLTVEQIREMRIGTEHNPIIRPDQVAKFAKYNLHPSFNGYQIQGDIKGGAFLQTYGEKYVNWMAPLKSLVDAGTHVVFNTDLHLTDLGPEWKSMESPEQWRGSIWAIMEFFITRNMPANKTYFPANGLTYVKSEALDKVRMMKAATIWSAELLLREKEIGSLEVGKLADFQVIDKDYFAIPDDQVHTVKTLLTAVGGKTVYKAQNY
ncbi:MAG: amidohydrolase family protein [Acidobacteria bacterium]|nr:amidohydrolase family protein [Acidobacteriota bacterium]